jgi:RNA polymerase sigma factor (TIGR02999 family)
MIRRVLVDHARRKFADKRGGRIPAAPLDEALSVTVRPDVDLIALDESLRELAEFDTRKCQVVEMRFFAGLPAREIASALGTTEAVVRRDWTIARAWLYRRLQGVSAP